MAENKQVRVDNWGVFFLQRLQLFFNKTDFCDLTLQFAGNVQLKVHRLVLNVCTEYFDHLERSDRLIDENVILMPEALQPDVVVPIINFMYTGLLEYPQEIYNRLCQAADLMNISVLTKLLDAQKPPALINKSDKVLRPKVKEVKPEISSNTFSQVKKPTPKIVSSEYPSPTISSKRSSAWKRKTTFSSNSTFSCRSDSMHRNSDPLALDEAKPTRFEWPEDDLELSNLDMMDMSGFGDISYNSKPLLREDEVKPIIKGDSKSELSKDTVHEIHFDDRSNIHEPSRNGVEKRKAETSLDKSPKRIRIVESEKDTTISVIANENSSNFDPTKIVSEILKKYPHLVKKKKNIKLKIIAKTNEKETPKVQSSSEKASTEKTTVKTVIKKASSHKLEPEKPVKGSVWNCKECVSQGEPMEFALYYLYRKHMTDVHSTKFDPRICKYCGIAFSRKVQHSYHLFTKHGIKPLGGQSFPSCSLCPYVALSKEALQVHESKHEKTEMQCTTCKLAFISSDAIAGHLQITGHMGKIKKNVYDCQYCTKTSQSSISLLSHIKSNHEAEGKRDGIISLEEVDLEVGDDILTDEVEVEEQEPVEAYIPETQKNKVNIISDVTVPVSKAKTTEPVRLDQTKAHVSVPTSIATSLGLLDIVVLDDNQQFILHNQTQQAGSNQTEYILPQIDARNVTAEGLPSNDELVMVLTDQDYKDGHTGIATDNSNIVVLYSHPADGQQGQFITSQGNIMVNSETGLLEIRNGAAIATTSANQIVMSAPADSHIETIEMIQREIEGGHDLKQESFYESQKPKELEQTQEPVDYIENQQVEVQSQPSLEKEVMETSEEVIHGEIKSDSERTIEEQEVSTSNPPTLNDSVEEQSSIETSTEQLEQSTLSEISEPCDSKDMVPMEIDTSLNEENPSVDKGDISRTEHVEELPETQLEEAISSSENITEKMQQEVIVKTAEIEQGIILQKADEQHLDDEDHKLSVDEKDFSMNSDETQVDDPDETMLEQIGEEEIKDKSDNLHSTGEIESSEKQSPSTVEKEEEKPSSPTDKPVDMDCEEGAAQKEKQVTEPVDINSIEIMQSESDKDNQECMTSSQSAEANDIEEETDKQSECTKGSTTMSILDDWEDTDSQQSDNKMKSIKKGAQETVHKLMDDWDEEEVEK